MTGLRSRMTRACCVWVCFSSWLADGNEAFLSPTHWIPPCGRNDACVLALNLLEHRFSTGRTAGFIRWKSTAGIPIMPDESGINDRMNSVLHLAIRSIRSHPLNPYKTISGIGVTCVNLKRLRDTKTRYNHSQSQYPRVIPNEREGSSPLGYHEVLSIAPSFGL